MSPRNWILIVAILIGAVAAFMFFSSPDEEPVSEPVAVPAPAPKPPKVEPPPASPVAPEPEPAPIVLPPLDASDDFVRERAASISSSDTIARALETDQLVRKLTTVVENLAVGGVARDPVAVFAPKEKFSVVREGDRLYMNPDAYRRFDGVAAIVETLDAQQAVAMVHLIEPLMADAYRELGVQDVDVDERLKAGIDVLLATPEVNGDIELKQPSVMYEFADPRLQALLPAQKVLIRMGPANAAKVRARLREMRALLD
ncbi:MAG TPA: DUF3014 domain-containing protein [Pseudomonadales bacterium]|nr:DUF3014 domain-containing protein [Pseudomonadales bacterium]